MACLLCVLTEARHHVQTLINWGSFCNPLGKLANVTVAFSLNKKINIDKICLFSRVTGDAAWTVAHHQQPVRSNLSQP